MLAVRMIKHAARRRGCVTIRYNVAPFAVIMSAELWP